MTDLFTEQARRDDSIGSHKNADRLHKTPELTERVFTVLRAIRDNPGKTASDLGLIMFAETGDLSRSTWGHKVCKKLEVAGYIARSPRIFDDILVCAITDQGRKELERYERANNANRTD